MTAFRPRLFPGRRQRRFRLLPLIVSVCLFCSCASGGGAASAEEYYALGQAYFDLGRYGEAERWFNRALAADKTKTASAYNLGRIAFEQGRYAEALRIFDGILAEDPGNVLALKAAAYTRIQTGELDKAEALYGRVLKLVPESADDGYNYALVLSALNKHDKAEEVLSKYPFALDENDGALLLLARVQYAQNKAEAADTYSRWLKNNSDLQVRYEYAQTLERGAFYARALEEYRGILESANPEEKPPRSEVRFALARLLLVADSQSGEGLVELRAALSEGFAEDRIRELLADSRIDPSAKEAIEQLLSGG
ncbi:MAG: tetratricopeptide repeat protein [Treponema sp.]|jgi:tetratricopeptide (TPR) repeat protein|nr:tetratricopeptide repeat protein [Treponema sp.]